MEETVSTRFQILEGRDQAVNAMDWIIKAGSDILLNILKIEV